MKKNMNGRRRALFDEELTEQMRAQPAGTDARRARSVSAHRGNPAQGHSTGRNAGGGMSVISAILTGRRSRGVACLIVAAVISLSAIVSVAASIVASHISYAQDGGAATAPDEKNVLSASGGAGENDPVAGSNSADGRSDGDRGADGKPDGGSAAGNENEDASSEGGVNGQNGSDATADGTGETQDFADTAADAENTADVPAASGEAVPRYTVKIGFWDKESVSVETAGATLGEVISASGTELSAAQLANLDLSMTVDSDITVYADVVTYETEDVEETIPYETEYVQSASLAAGVTEVTQKGVEGNQTRRFTVTYVNGAEVSRVQTASWVDAYVQNQVITTGTGQSVADSAPAQTQPPQSTEVAGTDTGAGTVTGANGVTYSYSSYLDVRATCYYAGGTTAYGIPADENVIGVDPSVIPFGTRVYVVGPYGDFGVRIAADCGNMYGNRIDVCLNRDNPLAPGFGWQDMRVYILD